MNKKFILNSIKHFSYFEYEANIFIRFLKFLKIIFYNNLYAFLFELHYYLHYSSFKIIRMLGTAVRINLINIEKKAMDNTAYLYSSSSIYQNHKLIQNFADVNIDLKKK